MNSFPKESVELYKLAKSGEIARALELYQWFMPLLHLDVDVKLVQFIKLANKLTGEGSEWVRRPRMELVGPERDLVTKVVNIALRKFFRFVITCLHG